MNKHRYAKIIFFGIILTTVFWYGWTQAQPANSESEQNSSSEVGRDDPFANFLGNEKPAAQKVSQIPQLVEEKPELFIETVTLKFLDAKNLKSVIAKMSTEEYGKIEVDSKSNSLIICDTEENLKKILTKIRKADKTPEQIMIEVVILDVQLGDDTEIGVDWTKFFEPERDLAYKQTLIPTTSITGGLLTLTKNNIAGTVRALQEIRNVEILASPRILVASGEEAFIQTVEEIPYVELSQTSGGGASTYAISSTAFKEAGVTLKVKATVTDEQKILMAIEPEQSINTGEAGVGATTVPIVDKRKAKTTLIMEDGQVLVMGGLRKKEIRITKNQIPLLGDIPLVGFLFSYDKRDVKNSELLVLISPHVNKGEPVPEDTMKKFKELKDKPTLSLPSDWRDPFRNISNQSKEK
jgi:type II secretory pathway component GspD/PulD (secretin)